MEEGLSSIWCRFSAPCIVQSFQPLAYIHVPHLPQNIVLQGLVNSAAGNHLTIRQHQPMSAPVPCQVQVMHHSNDRLSGTLPPLCHQVKELLLIQ